MGAVQRGRCVTFRALRQRKVTLNQLCERVIPQTCYQRRKCLRKRLCQNFVVQISEATIETLLDRFDGCRVAVAGI